MVLGLTFLSQYATTFNINTKSITFTPSKFSDEGVSLGKDPDYHEKPGMSTETLIIIFAVVGCILVILMICCCVE